MLVQASQDALRHLEIIMVGTKFPENIGMAARACANTGCGHLTLVSPAWWDKEKARPLATAKGEPLLDAIEVKPTLGDALAPNVLTFGTTARTGGWRRGLLTPEQAAALDSGDMLRVGVFVTDDMRFIEETARAARLDRIQLHGDQSMTCADRLSRTLGAERLIRVLWPERYPDLAALEETMNRHAASTGMFLLDAGMSGGGSGKRIGSERLRGLNAPRPWLLAGGLTPENVKETVAACVPDGVDFNSGLESEPGRKDPSRMQAALTALRG